MADNILIRDADLAPQLVATQNSHGAHMQRFTSQPAEPQSATWLCGDLTSGKTLLSAPASGLDVFRRLVIDRISASSAVAERLSFREALPGASEESLLARLYVDALGTAQLGATVLQVGGALRVYGEATVNPESAISIWWHVEDVTPAPIVYHAVGDLYAVLSAGTVEFTLPPGMLLGDLLLVYTFVNGVSAPGSMGAPPDDWSELASESYGNCEARLLEHYVSRDDLAAGEFSWSYVGEAVYGITLALGSAAIEDYTSQSGVGGAVALPAIETYENDELLVFFQGASVGGFTGPPAIEYGNPDDWSWRTGMNTGNGSVALFTGTRPLPGDTGLWTTTHADPAATFGCIGAALYGDSVFIS